MYRTQTAAITQGQRRYGSNGYESESPHSSGTQNWGIPTRLHSSAILRINLLFGENLN